MLQRWYMYTLACNALTSRTTKFQYITTSSILYLWAVYFSDYTYMYSSYKIYYTPSVFPFVTRPPLTLKFWRLIYVGQMSSVTNFGSKRTILRNHLPTGVYFISSSFLGEIDSFVSLKLIISLKLQKSLCHFLWAEKKNFQANQSYITAI